MYSHKPMLPTAEISILAVVTDPGLNQELGEALNGFDLYRCSDVKSALSEVFEADHIPDLILLDLPDAEALRFSQLIHEDRHLALIPILLFYDERRRPDPERVLALGAADLVPLPLNHDQLIALIHKHELTRRGWWQSLHIEAPELPERLLEALKLARSKSPSPRKGLGAPGESFQEFRALLYQKSGLSQDRIRYLQPYTSEQLYQLGSALYLDSLQLAEALGEYLHLPVIDSFEGLEVALGAVPAAFCRKNRILPLHDAQGQPLVAISNPFQLEVVDLINRLYKSYQLVVAAPELIEEKLDPEFRYSETWREWMSLRQLRAKRAAFQIPTVNAVDDRRVLPHKLPPRKAKGAAAPEVAQPAPATGEADAAAQLALDYFYRGSNPQTEAVPGSASEASPADLPANVPLEPLVPLPVASAREAEPGSTLAPAVKPELRGAKQHAVSDERQAQLMEQRLSRAYQAYREKKRQQEQFETNQTLAGLIESESDPEVAPIIHLVNSLIEKAHHLRASDIHIEPRENEVVIRYRIDGMLKIMHRLQPRAIIKPIAARIKIMASLDISERRLPQDGHIHFIEHSPGHDISLRVATVPMAYGEKIVLRLLESEHNLLDLEDMGFSEVALSQYRHGLRAPYGMILHVGPTGSGKTSTLYAALGELNDAEINIQTVENPIEYMLDGINQLEVRPEIGLDFARVLRAYLRQDPDVILVGEVRDEETAQIAIEAALTGHLLLSTLHTNDAASTVVRLLEMGVKPYLLTSSLLMICAQRLLRRLCPACRVPVTADAGVRHLLGRPESEALTLYAPGGCEECQHSGYFGRIGVFELLVPSDELRQLMQQPGVSSQQIKQAAVRAGMRSLFREGVDKVLAGVTSLEEMTLKLMPDQPESMT